MMELCATLVDSSPFLEYAGNVLNAPIMIYVLFATMGINTTYATDSSESTLLEVKGILITGLTVMLTITK